MNTLNFQQHENRKRVPEGLQTPTMPRTIVTCLIRQQHTTTLKCKLCRGKTSNWQRAMNKLKAMQTKSLITTRALTRLSTAQTTTKCITTFISLIKSRIASKWITVSCSVPLGCKKNRGSVGGF
jgi:hypothetical protein